MWSTTFHGPDGPAAAVTAPDAAASMTADAEVRVVGPLESGKTTLLASLRRVRAAAGEARALRAELAAAARVIVVVFTRVIVVVFTRVDLIVLPVIEYSDLEWAFDFILDGHPCRCDCQEMVSRPMRVTLLTGLASNKTTDNRLVRTQVPTRAVLQWVKTPVGPANRPKRPCRGG